MVTIQGFPLIKSLMPLMPTLLLFLLIKMSLILSGNSAIAAALESK